MDIREAQSPSYISPSRVDSKPTSSKIICRYGRGCTHMQDPIHRDRFWHPSVPQLTGTSLFYTYCRFNTLFIDCNIKEEIIRSRYICNECGAPFRELHELQVLIKEYSKKLM